MQDYKSRIKIPIEGNADTNFYTKCNTLIAHGYNRIVIGNRGPYIEFTEAQIDRESIYIPSQDLWRVTGETAFYIEYRTADTCYIRVYYQKKMVNYADYLLEHYYVSPFDLKTDLSDEIILPLSKVSSEFSEKFF